MNHCNLVFPLLFLLPLLTTAQVWSSDWPDPPDYREGPCMQEVYNWFRPDNALSCTAKEVYANNVTCVDCPSTCTRGEFLTINVTGSLHFNSGRYDPGYYIARSACTPTAGSNCALQSQYCTVETFGTEDAAKHPSNIFSYDAKGGQDSCLDVDAGSGWDYPGDYEFPKNLVIFCGE